jgi:hypothetical protein
MTHYNKNRLASCSLPPHVSLLLWHVEPPPRNKKQDADAADTWDHHNQQLCIIALLQRSPLVIQTSTSSKPMSHADSKHDPITVRMVAHYHITARVWHLKCLQLHCSTCSSYPGNTRTLPTYCPSCSARCMPLLSPITNSPTSYLPPSPFQTLIL